MSIELYESKEVSSSKAINMVRTIYHACMNEAAIDNIGSRDVLTEMAVSFSCSLKSSFFSLWVIFPPSMDLNGNSVVSI